MFFDPLPIVHIYPNNPFGFTGHETENGHECWCEPRIAIVPKDHQFAKENHETRIVYHNPNLISKGDDEYNLPPKHVQGNLAARKLLRSIAEPPEGGWGAIELSEGLDRLVVDVFKNGWSAPQPQKLLPPAAINVTIDELHVEVDGKTQKLPDSDRPIMERLQNFFDINYLVDPMSSPHCQNCGQPFENCGCDDDDNDDDNDDEDDGGSHVVLH